jgi:hypothetical protein
MRKGCHFLVYTHISALVVNEIQVRVGVEQVIRLYPAAVTISLVTVTFFLADYILIPSEGHINCLSPSMINHGVMNWTKEMMT